MIRLGAIAVCFGLMVSCAEDEAPGAENPTASSSPTEQPTDQPTEALTESATEPVVPGTRIVATGSEFGMILFDDTRQAIYLFDVETTPEPRCYDACAQAWPPVLTSGEPVAGRGLDDALLGTVERTDGTVQVTYADHPLYFYAHEGKNEVLCHDVFLNGGKWYVVQPDGNAAPPG